MFIISCEEYQQELQFQGLNQSAQSLGSILSPRARQILPDLLDDQDKVKVVEEPDAITLNSKRKKKALFNFQSLSTF